ncbi:MAG: hypothetical protein WC841_02230 [Candidatus Shapirobacteria bacterium]|jgi:phosphoserine phosphatase
MAINNEEMENKIEGLVDNIKSKFPNAGCIVLADFDQCIVRDHVSRLNTNYFSDNYPVNQEKLSYGKSGEGREQVRALCELLIGLKVEVIKNSIRKLIGGTVLNPNGEPFLNICKKNKIPIVFVSCGLEWSVEELCRKHNLSGIFCIGDTFTEKNGIVTGVSGCLGAEDKGVVAKKFVERFPDRKIITVGHSAADRFLVEGGTAGYRVNLDSAGSLTNFEENYDIVSVGLDWKPVTDMVQMG